MKANIKNIKATTPETNVMLVYFCNLCRKRGLFVSLNGVIAQQR